MPQHLNITTASYAQLLALQFTNQTLNIM